MSNTIMTCFKDDSIFAWEADTLICKYELTRPEGKSPHFKTYSATRYYYLAISFLVNTKNFNILNTIWIDRVPDFKKCYSFQ